jgi:choline-sulfatase
MVASGKMHLIGADQLHGFERRLTPDIYPSAFKWTPNWRDYREHGIANDKACLIEDDIGLCEWSHQLDYDTNVQAQALGFLRSRGSSPEAAERPFCLLVSFTHPHPPYRIAKEFWDLYEGVEIGLPKTYQEVVNCQSQMDRWLYEYEGTPENLVQDTDRMYKLRRAYYGMVSFVDAQVAELMETLGTQGLRDNTAVIFTSDHGDLLCDRQLIEKRSFYEWSSRIPLIASFPRRWATGVTCVEPVSLIDFFPTLTEFADTLEPNDIDGRSFLELLENPRAEDPERIVISEYHGEGVKAPCFMARKGTFKYVYIHGHESQLFDLAKDPEETQNLAGQPAFSTIETSLREEILNRFNPDAIAADVQQSQKERILMQHAMDEGKPTNWDYEPCLDPSKSHV